MDNTDDGFSCLGGSFSLWGSFFMYSAGYTIVITVLSVLIMGNSDFMLSTYGMQFFLSDLTPNIGMFWYSTSCLLD
jgi:hypothetical protein